MYRLIRYTGKDGTDKLCEVAALHPLEGDFYWPLMVGNSIAFAYNDASGKMLRSSAIEAMDKVNDQLVIVTRNSVFVFEEVEENDDLF